ncbi:MAG: GNAT family N-acetyltransferase [Erysipelotrichaceae bacterium]|nr:GNAT family N-acetyltransferase [Erysipelotrichaceae bacterium]
MEVIVKRFNELGLDELYEIMKARVDVFVVEQQCPYGELDDKDQQCIHLYLKEDKLVAYLRILPAGVSFECVGIGRVLTLKRGEGLGNRLLSEGIKAAEELLGATCIRLEAQCYAIGYYEKHGFKVISDEFLEDGIPHVIMERRS